MDDNKEEVYHHQSYTDSNTDTFLCSFAWEKRKTQTSVKITVFWNMMPCSMVDTHWRFRGNYLTIRVHESFNPMMEAPSSSKISIPIYPTYYITSGTGVAQWLRCCTTKQKVAGSISDGVIGIFHWHNLSDCTMALGSTQRLTEMSTSSISWG